VPEIARLLLRPCDISWKRKCYLQHRVRESHCYSYRVTLPSRSFKSEDILTSFTEYRTSVLLAHANDCRCNFFLHTTVSSIADIASRILNRFIPDIPWALTYYFLEALRTLLVPDTSNLSRDANHAVLVEDFHGGRMLATSLLLLAVQVNDIKCVYDLRNSAVANFRAARIRFRESWISSSASRIPTILPRASTSSSHNHRVVQDAQPAAQSQEHQNVNRCVGWETVRIAGIRQDGDLSKKSECYTCILCFLKWKSRYVSIIFVSSDRFRLFLINLSDV